MGQLFPKYINTLTKWIIVGGACFVVGGVFLAIIWMRSPYKTKVNLVKQQPVPFSHKHHVDGLGIDCRFCHTTAETEAYAGIPATETCMKCHSLIWNDSPLLEPVRESYESGRPLVWKRVHDLPDHVYFNHSIHVQKGIGCVTCHGQVDQMPLPWKSESLYMEWCLECHRQPEKFVRPREEVFNMEWHPPKNAEEMRNQLAKDYKLNKMTECNVCHR